MKRFKFGFMSVLIIFAALLPASSAIAAGDFSITINNETPNHVYEAYQIFSGDLFINEVGNTSLSNIDWGLGINDNEFLKALKDNDKLPEILKGKFNNANSAADVAKVLDKIGDDSDFAQAFAKIAGKYLNSEKAKVSNYINDSYIISNLESGYYLVKDKDTSLDNKDDAYTRFILKIVGNVQVEPKSDIPGIEKKVKENKKYNGEYNDIADYNIGDEIPFRITGTLPINYDDYDIYEYIIRDTMSEGLTLNEGSIKITVDGGEIEPSKYEFLTNKDSVEKVTGFTIKFENLKKLTEVKSNSKIVVDFTATLNTHAVIGLPGNENKVDLEYSNNPNSVGRGKTPEDKVIVFTYELDGNKVDGGTENKDPLGEAEFVLYRKDNNKTEYAVINEDCRINSWTENKDDASAIVSDAGGKFNIVGLDDGIYYLEEIKAPGGYNKLKEPIEFEIKATTNNGDNWSGIPEDALSDLVIVIGNHTQTGSVDEGMVSIEIENNSGPTLPSTGGRGTTIFYIVGGILMVGAVVLFITKKRVSKK